MNLAEYILAALGGSRFMTMTGARGLVSQGENLVFTLPKRAKGKINKVKVEYNKAADAFDFTFYNFQPKSFKLDTVQKVDAVSVDSLQSVFSDVTGLLTSL